jgi:hypothetical protein
MTVDILVRTDPGKKPDLGNITKILLDHAKGGLWVHASNPRIVHTVTEEHV